MPYGSFLSGLTHPVLGADHFLAMVSVGILSAQIGGRAIWSVPATFVCFMALGGITGFIDSGFSGTEAGIAISVVLLGVAIAANKRLPQRIALVAVAIFGAFHGYAHGIEIPTVANPVTYASGFLSGTVALHLTGLIIGDISQHYATGKVVLRVAGSVIAVIGAIFIQGSF